MYPRRVEVVKGEEHSCCMTSPMCCLFHRRRGHHATPWLDRPISLYCAVYHVLLGSFKGTGYAHGLLTRKLLRPCAGARLKLVGPRGPVSAAGLYFKNSQSPYDGPTTGPVFMVRCCAACRSCLLLLSVATFVAYMLLPCRSRVCCQPHPCLPTMPHPMPPKQAAKLSVLSDLGEGITVPNFVSQVGLLLRPRWKWQ